MESLWEHKNAVLLLDEPGLSLHLFAQRDLSAFFDNLSETNLIVYTAHSPLLVDADRIDRARKVYVAADGTTKATSNLRHEETDQEQAGAAYAVHSDLGLSVAESLLIGCQPVVVEGASDQHYLTAIHPCPSGFSRTHRMADHPQETWAISPAVSDRDVLSSADGYHPSQGQGLQAAVPAPAPRRGYAARPRSGPRVREVDFGTLRPMPTEFVGRAGDRRFGDVLWLAGLRDGRRAMLMIEIQSGVDLNMAARMATYAGARDPRRVDVAADLVLECETGSELLDRVNGKPRRSP